MKKVLLIAISLVFFLALVASVFGGLSKTRVAFSSESTKPYARITGTSTYLLSSPNSLETSKLFLLPETYFVELLAPAVDGFFSAKYMEVQGYVAVSQVRCVAVKPAVPYAENASFRVFAQNGLNIRSTPKESEGIINKLGTLGFLENNVQFYGTVEGEEAVPFRGNTWIYCKYSPTTSDSIFGFVYAGYCDMITPITKNLEEAQYVETPTFTTGIDDGETSGETFGKMSVKQQILLLSLLCLPAILLIWLLFKPSQIATGKAKKVAKIKNRIDYFELD